MIKLPTQFDARARQHIETAAAGGSTSTCCSSCVVTLGSAVVASSMYLAHLRKRTKELDGENAPAESSAAGSSPWGTPEGNSTVDLGATASPATQSGASVPEAASRRADRDKGLLDSAWFWVTMVIVLSVFSSMVGDIGAMVVSTALAMLSLVGWVRLHQRAGVGPVQAIVVGVAALVLILGAIVLEAMAWMGAL